MITWRGIDFSRRILLFVLSPILGLILINQFLRGQERSYSSYLPFPNIPTDNNNNNNNVDASGYSQTDPESIPCRDIPGLEDVLIVLKTGVTEALDKVPVHLRTTLRCVPHYAVFSDYEEDIIVGGSGRGRAGHARTVNVLRNVSDNVKRTNQDFELYNRVHRFGRAGLQMTETTREGDNVENPFGKADNPGWKLDKWKFLPMIDEALRLRPDAKWYVFFEADSYIVWPNLVRWLGRLDLNKPIYMGSQMQIGDVVFAYGGAGIILNNKAMRAVSEYRAPRVDELDQFTDWHWAGDCVLGKTVGDAGVQYQWTWPMQQTARVWEINPFTEGYGRNAWCHPIVSFHHMTADDVIDMWRFEMNWFGRGNQLLLFEDVFRNLAHSFILSSQPSSSPTLPYAKRANWDNLSQKSLIQTFTDIPTVSDCAQKCAENNACLQFAYEHGNCSTGVDVMRGVERYGVDSGWMMSRIEQLVNKKGKCEAVLYLP